MMLIAGQVIFQQPDDFLFIILVARLLRDGLSRIFLIMVLVLGLEMKRKDSCI